MFSKYVAIWSFKDGVLNFYDTNEFLQSKSEIGLVKPELILSYNGFIDGKTKEFINFNDPFDAEQFRDDLERNFVLFFDGTFYHNSLMTDGEMKKLDFSGTLAFAFMQAEVLLDDVMINALSNVMPTFRKNWFELLDFLEAKDQKIMNLLSFTMI